MGVKPLARRASALPEPLEPTLDRPVTSGESTGGLTLEGPSEMSAETLHRPVFRANSAQPAGSEVLTLEPPDSVDHDDRLDPLPDDSSRRSPSLPTSSPRIEPTPRSSSSSEPNPQRSTRRGRFFGLFPAPVVIPPALSATRTNSTSSPKSPEAAAEAALQARIEKQARLAVGERVRSIEVQVEQKRAIVQARGVKFYQKRAVRKSLESLPALAGLRSTIEVLD